MTLNPQQAKALELSALGLHVVPAYKPQPGATRADHAAAQGKLPLGGDEWQKAPRIRQEKLAETWKLGWNIAVLTGAASGVFVWDIDGEAGTSSMAALVAQHGPLPQTYAVRTGSGGWHYYFAMPEFDVRNSQGKVAPGIDIRGTGGFVIAATSANADGPYSDGGRMVPFAPAPDWMLELVRPKPAPRLTASAMTTGLAAVERTPELARYEDAAVEQLVARLDALQRPWQPGAGWDTAIFEVSCSLLELANAAWTALTEHDVQTIIATRAPWDEKWDGRGAKLEQARKRVGGGARPAPELRTKVDDSDMFTDPAVTHSAGPVTAPARIVTDGKVDVGLPAEAAAWLRDGVGSGRLSGMFSRKGELVFTPRVGQEGYVEVKDTRAENAAAISLVTPRRLQARVQNRFEVFRWVESKKTKGQWEEKAALFPLEAAEVVVAAPDDAPNLRELRGVVHTPTFRPDGSLIDTPGYDVATGLLFLPTGGQPGVIPQAPTLGDVELAVKWLDYMLQDFAFVTAHDRASYLGLMLTPLLRSLIPAPYKLGVIEAHQPGSGKTFLARAITSIHGGAMHPELPATEEELSKVLSAILDTQTAPVVVFDNVTGIIRSSRLAGLLTSPTYSARRLGTGTTIEAENDRLWIITGNNAVLSGDLGRRNVRVRIDPGMPNPEARTGFAIADFESWVRTHRGELLWALLVLVKHWVVRGMSLPDEVTQDSYGRWTATIRGVLGSAGVPGTFDHVDTRAEDEDPEVEEWTSLARAVHSALGDRAWTVKELLTLVAPLGFEGTEGRPISMDDLPGAMMKERQSLAPKALVRPFGNFLRNRKGRWFGEYCFVDTEQKRHHAVVWKVVYRPASSSTAP